MAPDVSVVIPTHNRTSLVTGAVEAALAQTHRAIEVVIVDDGSTPPTDLPHLHAGDRYDARVRLLRLDPNRGLPAARNAGLAEARGRFVTFCDDDDRLTPDHVCVCLAVARAHAQEGPIVVLTTKQVVDEDGRVLQTCVPPDRLPRGACFGLDPLPPGRSYLSKQTMFVERDVLKRVGGWDEAFRTRQNTELFLRLGEYATFVGTDRVTYRQLRHSGERLSGNPASRLRGLAMILDKHGPLLDRHPRGKAMLLVEHARKLARMRQWKHAGRALAGAAAASPVTVVARAAGVMVSKVTGRPSAVSAD